MDANCIQGQHSSVCNIFKSTFHVTRTRFLAVLLFSTRVESLENHNNHDKHLSLSRPGSPLFSPLLPGVEPSFRLNISNYTHKNCIKNIAISCKGIGLAKINFEMQRREHVIEICLHYKNISVEEIKIQWRY